VPAAFFCADFNSFSCGKERSCTLRRMNLGLIAVLTGMCCLAAAQTGATAGVAGAASVAITNPVAQTAMPFEWGVLTQGGFGVTEDRGSFRFMMAGVHAGKVLTPNEGHGMLRGNFEYAVEAFLFWQSYTPTMQRQNCVLLLVPTPEGQTYYSCSAPFTVGGTYTGVSLTPIILRWNFAGTRRWAPWIQGAGGVVWTNHKYPAFGGVPVCSTACVSSSIGDNGPNDDTSAWNFTPQFGVGAHYFLSSKRSIDFGANAIHISSASLGDKNPGVNASVQFTLGYSWWK
jgi:lipid A 3-O-deacylase